MCGLTATQEELAPVSPSKDMLMLTGRGTQPRAPIVPWLLGQNEGTCCLLCLCLSCLYLPQLQTETAHKEPGDLGTICGLAAKQSDPVTGGHPRICPMLTSPFVSGLITHLYPAMP